MCGGMLFTSCLLQKQTCLSDYYENSVARKQATINTLSISFLFSGCRVRHGMMVSQATGEDCSHDI